MPTIAVATPARRRVHAAPRALSALRSDSALFLLAIAVIAVHVIDDSFLQPPRGTSPGDHLVGGLVPLAVLAGAAWAYPRLRGGRRGALAVFVAPLGIAAGVEGVYYASALGPAGDDFTGLLCIPAGLLLLGVGAVTLWRTRRVEGNRPWRYLRRALFGAAAVPIAAMVMLPIAISYVYTHTARAVVPANQLGVATEDVSFRTSDGLELHGWYVPSKNGAAVISFPGRKGPQRQGRMLVRHGYGVLMFDRRGEGESDGQPNAFGWGGDRDIKAAIAFLQRRPDVDPDRIGGIGLSVGGELMLETAAETEALRAVVSEGAGARMFSEELKEELSGVSRVFTVLPSALKNASLAVFNDESLPPDLETIVGKIAPRPLMLIAAPNSPNGEDLNRRYVRAAGQPATLWEIPESRHVGGLSARPREYERRVVGFFDGALRP
jgi:hypothetical protein